MHETLGSIHPTTEQNKTKMALQCLRQEACHKFQTTLGCRVKPALILKGSKMKRPDSISKDRGSSLLRACGAEVGSLHARFDEATYKQASHYWGLQLVSIQRAQGVTCTPHTWKPGATPGGT